MPVRNLPGKDVALSATTAFALDCSDQVVTLRKHVDEKLAAQTQAAHTAAPDLTV